MSHDPRVIQPQKATICRLAAENWFEIGGDRHDADLIAMAMYRMSAVATRVRKNQARRAKVPRVTEADAAEFIYELGRYLIKRDRLAEKE